MTRDEFIVSAMKDIEAATSKYKNSLLNIVEKAWAEGKKNAEIDEVTEVIRSVLTSMKDQGEFDK